MAYSTVHERRKDTEAKAVAVRVNYRPKLMKFSYQPSEHLLTLSCSPLINGWNHYGN
jgi:hypothetical protein